MIDGLKVTVSAQELRGLCAARAEYHDQRSAVYQKQADFMRENHIGEQGSGATNVPSTCGPIEPQEVHKKEAEELRFIVSHLDDNETYLLDRGALYRLGIAITAYT